MTDTEGERVLIPLNPDDVPSLERFLSETDPFVATTLDAENPYRLVDYLHNARHGEFEVRALLDRNLVSRVVGLASGQSVDHESAEADTYRLAAGCMSFLITSDVQIEPSIAMHEFAAAAPAEAKAQIRPWRVADHVHPQAYLEVALGRDCALDRSARADAWNLMSSRPEEAPPLEKPLRHFRRHYAALAQVALLERTGAAPMEKLRSLIAWSRDVAFFDGLAICFAIVFFGRHRSGRMLKRVRSADGARCLEGVRNAAWDLTYLSYWVKYAHEQKSNIWIFATGDRVLASLARAAIGDRSARELFQENWTRREAEELFEAYHAARPGESPAREAELGSRFERLDEITTEIEERILNAAA